MAAQSSQMLPLETPVPEFSLPSTDGSRVSSADFAGARALLIVFVCNHCPYVIHVRHELEKLYKDYSPLGVNMVAINSNDIDEYPEDSPANMRERAEEWGWRFPYLFDEDQSVAKALTAACTPDAFLFANGLLAYRGQLDSSRPNNGVPVSGADIRRAIEAVLAGDVPDPEQHPSLGCSIKWKPGNDPLYLTDDL